MGAGRIGSAPCDCDSVPHFLQVLDNSPAQRAGLETYFDFVISIDGIRLVRLMYTSPHLHIVSITYTLLPHTRAHFLCGYKAAV